MASNLPFRNPNKFANSLLLLTAFLFLGCEPKIETGYGRSSGPGFTSSLNGTGVLHQMIEGSGFPVDRYSKMSPRWDSYQTVFWIPDYSLPPTQDHISWVEWWMRKRDQRTLVYVARDYDATISYWDQLCGQAEAGSENETVLRKKYHQQLVDTYQRMPLMDGSPSCSWFQLEPHSYTKAEKIDGPLAEAVQTDTLNLQYSSLPEPRNVRNKGEYNSYEVEILLNVDERPMVYKLHHRRLGFGRVIIVGNASFLLNLPLTNPANQQLAEALIGLATEKNYPGESVLFIENNNELPILKRDIPETHSTWTWITKKPLRYIVPNTLFCSLLFCFVYFPIFGRARKTKPDQTANFKDHVDALGQLLKRTGKDSEAQTWIEIYEQRKRHGSTSKNSRTD